MMSIDSLLIALIVAITTIATLSAYMKATKRGRWAEPTPTPAPTPMPLTPSDELQPAARGHRPVKIVPTDGAASSKPVSVNYHFTRQCNYECQFCFHTAKTSHVESLDRAKQGLAMLKDAGMRKINFSGGEPFLQEKGRFVGEMVRYCKETLRLESVTIVSNGSRVTEAWFQEYGQFLDIIAISCDSFDENVNTRVGRRAAKKEAQQTAVARRVKGWCDKYDVRFKLNTVVHALNKMEDMSTILRELNPCRWKVFQCLIIDGENASAQDLRNARALTVSKEEFDDFIARHRTAGCNPVPEDNDTMRNSYLILDEYMRFLNNTGGKKQPSPSILEVGVAAALTSAGFDENMFYSRGGEYDWARPAIANMSLTPCDISNEF